MKSIVVAFERERLHRWPEAPKSYAWLAHPHMHRFRAEVRLEVFHNEREIEFFAFRDQLVKQWAAMPEEAETWSCERMAEYLSMWVKKTYPGRAVGVRVFEDENFGAIVDEE